MMKNTLAGGLAGGAILLAALLIAAPVASAAENEQKEPVGLDQITVTGKTVSEPVTSPYWVPDSSKPQTEVITKEEIEAINPQTVWDILEQVPGMDVTFQGRQHLDFGYMRGTGNFGFILDGVYLLSPDRVVATLPVSAIESITIVRDATALTLGPLTNFGTTTGDSNVGYIVIKTKRATKLEGGLVASYGSFHTEKEDLYQGAKIGNFDYRITASDQSSLGKTNWYNGDRNESLLFHGGYDGPFLQGDVLYYTGRGMQEFERGTIEVPTTVTVGKGKKAYTYLDWSKVGSLDTSKWKLDPIVSDMVAVNLKKPWSDSQTTTFTYAYDSLLTSSMTTTFPTQTPVTVSDQDTHGQNLNVAHVITTGPNTFKTGGQFLQSVSPTGLAPSIGTRTDESVYSLFAVDQYRLFNNRMTVDGALRMDQKHYNDNPVTGVPDHKWAKEVNTFALGTSYKLTPMFTLTGRYSHVENSTAGYYTTPTTLSALPPEIDTRWEGGILAHIHPFFNPCLTGFYYNVKNEAVTTGKYYVDPATGEEIDYVTPADVRTKGMELKVTGQPVKSLTYGSLTYGLQYTYVQTNDHKTNISIAHNMASGLITYRLKNAFANFTVRYVGPHNETTSPAGVIYYELGNYTRADANVGYNFNFFNRDMRVTVYARNLGDVHYATRYVSGAYLDPGLSYGVRLAVSFF